MRSNFSVSLDFVTSLNFQRRAWQIKLLESKYGAVHWLVQLKILLLDKVPWDYFIWARGGRATRSVHAAVFRQSRRCAPAVTVSRHKVYLGKAFFKNPSRYIWWTSWELLTVWRHCSSKHSLTELKKPSFNQKTLSVSLLQPRGDWDCPLSHSSFIKVGGFKRHQGVLIFQER